MIFQHFTLLRKARRFKKGVHLSAAERAMIKGELYAYMKRVPALERAHIQKAGFAGFFGRSFVRASTAALSTVLIVSLLGGGVSYAAENTLPGDVLYPLKVSVTEPVRESLMMGTEARAAWAFERADRRLVEAATLAARDRLDEKTIGEIQVRFQESSRRGQAYVAQLQAEGKLNVTGELLAKFEGSLRGHGRALQDPDEQSFEDTNSEDPAGDNGATIAATMAPETTLVAPARAIPSRLIAPEKRVVPNVSVSPKARMALEIQKDIRNIQAARSDIERQIGARHNGQYKKAAESAKSTAQEKVLRASQRVSDKEAKRMADQNGDEPGGSSGNELKTNIFEAEEALSEGEASLQEEEYGPALIRFHNALRISTEVETHIEDEER